MKLIRLGSSLIGWIVPLSAKIRHSGGNKLEHSPRSSCEQVRRNCSIKSNCEKGRISGGHIARRSTTPRDVKKSNENLDILCESWISYVKLKICYSVLRIFIRIFIRIELINCEKINQPFCGDYASWFAFIFFSFGVRLMSGNEMRKFRRAKRCWMCMIIRRLLAAELAYQPRAKIYPRKTGTRERSFTSNISPTTVYTFLLWVLKCSIRDVMLIIFLFLYKYI